MNISVWKSVVLMHVFLIPIVSTKAIGQSDRFKKVSWGVNYVQALLLYTLFNHYIFILKYMQNHNTIYTNQYDLSNNKVFQFDLKI